MTAIKNDPPRDFTREPLIITRIFNAPRALVFQAWTDPKHLAEWWGPRGFTTPVCEVDARLGGAIHIHMRSPDGTVYPMDGKFLEIVEPERLVFTTMPLDQAGEAMFEVLNTVTFAEHGDGTKLTLEARVIKTTAVAPQYLAGMETGWTQSLERMEQKVTEFAARHIVISREFDAPRELVWKAMTDLAHVVRWWGPRGFTTTIEEMDVRPGGVWKHVMRGPDGVNYPNQSIFKEVVKPERLVFSHGGKREGGPGVSFTATWTFDAMAKDRTRVTIRMVFASAEARDFVVREFGAVEGGKQTLARLAEHLVEM